MESSLQDIERAIDALTAQEREELTLWLDRQHPQAIDGKLESNLQAGRLDDRIKRAVSDHEAGRTQLL